jgi:hypothetical protein
MDSKIMGNKFETIKSIEIILKLFNFHKICRQMKKNPQKILLILNSDKIVNDKMCNMC